MSERKPLRVLIVDDEPNVAALHAHFVEVQAGFTVVAIAHSGTEALTAIAHANPDIILLDFGLPDVDGREILRRIRASNRASIEIIALTAASDLESVRFARSAGVHHYLVKPFDGMSLRERLERVRQEREVYEQVTSQRLRQNEVDALLREGSSLAAVKPLPKGLGAETLEKVRRALLDMDSALSTTEIAQAIGTSRATARRYLEFLCQIGEVEVEPRYGNVGRPENRYLTKHT